MGLKLETMCVVLDSDNSDELSAFYEKLLGWIRYEHSPDDEWIVVNNGKRDGLPEMIFQQIENYVRPVWPVVSGKQLQMVHLDFHVDDVDEGVRHAISCGAELSKVQLEDSWRVMLDPAGHPFCILPKRYPKSDESNKKTVTGITEFAGCDDKVYTSVLFDCFDNACLGPSMTENMRTEFVIETFERAAASYDLTSATSHSDCGAQYTSRDFRDKLKELGIGQSVNSAAGRCHDNAKCESMWARGKEETMACYDIKR